MKTLLASLMLITTLLYAQQRDLQKITALTTLKGTTYTNVRVLKVTALEIRIMHDGGAATVQQTDLPEETRKFFGYDATLAAQEKERLEQEKMKAVAAVEERKEKTAEKQAGQKKENEEINRHEAKAVKMRVHVITKNNGIITAQAWKLNVVEDPRKKDFSGRPMMIEVNSKHPASIEMHGFTASAGDVFVTVLYPVDLDIPFNRRYADSPAAAWRLARKK